MTHGSLFSGIGGFDLAAEWVGWENVFHCEWNEFGQKVLKYYWPNAESFTDITKTDFTKYEGTIDLISGGFPCQPYSQAGKRLGKEDDRHLWPEMLRAIREVKPSWVVGENVYGLVNWNGGLVFHEVQADLEAEGYEVWPFLLPAVSVNAPRRRDRIWFVAYTKSRRARQFTSKNERWKNRRFNNNDEIWDATNSSIIGCDNGSNYRQERCFSEDKRITEESKSKRKGRKCGTREVGSIDEDVTDTQNTRQQARIERQGEKQSWGGDFTMGTGQWERFPTVSPVCNGDDGLSDRLDSITFPKWRAESIKAGGNAIVPQVAFQIFKAIIECDNQSVK